MILILECLKQKEAEGLERYKKVPYHRLNKIRQGRNKEDFLTLRKNISASNIKQVDKIRRKTSNLSFVNYNSLQNAYTVPESNTSLPKILFPVSNSHFGLLNKEIIKIKK